MNGGIENTKCPQLGGSRVDKKDNDFIKSKKADVFLERRKWK